MFRNILRWVYFDFPKLTYARATLMESHEEHLHLKITQPGASLLQSFYPKLLLKCFNHLLRIVA